ncbi:MAG: Rid family detoxifying hydrolase [Gemmatimonadota bacterium]
MTLQTISTANAPQPAGHYSQAVVHGDVVYVAGQLPIDPASADRTPGSIEQQTEQVLRNVEAVLLAAGSRLDHVVQMTVYVSDIAHWAQVNTIYAKVMGAHRPARAVVPVPELHHGYAIEIQAIAAVVAK